MAEVSQSVQFLLDLLLLLLSLVDQLFVGFDLSTQLLQLQWLVARLQHLKSRLLCRDLSLVLADYCLFILDPSPVLLSHHFHALRFEGRAPVVLSGLVNDRYFFLSAFVSIGKLILAAVAH